MSEALLPNPMYLGGVVNMIGLDIIYRELFVTLYVVLGEILGNEHMICTNTKSFLLN